ncbi:MAG: winged helix-turn-helix domain-containing protein [Sphingomicrobium sp.]
MSSVRDLSDRKDFRIGDLIVRPARRLLEGPESQASLEPITMLLFLALAEGEGEVVTRTCLFDEIWGGAAVGDDSLNRSIGQVRKALVSVLPGKFTLETIPRTGYSLRIGDAKKSALRTDPVTRRTAIVASGAVIFSAAGTWYFTQSGTQTTDNATAKDRGHQILRAGIPREEPLAIKYLQAAVEQSPKDSEAWGLLALAHRSRLENGTPDEVRTARRECELAADRALSLDPNEGNALTALAAMTPEYGHWIENERALRNVLKRAPDNVPALNFLTLLLQCVGRATESFDLNERALKLDPRDVTPQWRQAMKSWIFGKPEQSDRILTRALEIWPDHPAMWNTRLMTFAYTGRPAEGLEYMRSQPRPRGRSEKSIKLWELTLKALATSDSGERDAARKTLIAVGSSSTGQSTHAVMALSAMNFVDDAFLVAKSYFGLRGQFVGMQKMTPNELLINDNGWRRTMFLFTPATRPMRIDQRFDELMRLIGLTEYWTRSRSSPDKFLFR